MARFTISLIIVGFMFAHASNAEVDPGSIVGAWLFDETGGKVAKDSSDNGNDGDLVGGAKWVKVNSATPLNSTVRMLGSLSQRLVHSRTLRS